MARITGAFRPPPSVDAAAVLRETLDAHAQILDAIDEFRARAGRETQMNRRVELNLEIKRLEARLGELAKRL